MVQTMGTPPPHVKQNATHDACSRACFKRHVLKPLSPFHGVVHEWYNGKSIEHHYRFLIVKTLLRDDEMIVISIDDHEVHNLHKF